jgi:hypothetical protein
MKVIFLSVILLSGCQVSIHDYEIESIVEQCKARGGISVVDTFFKVGGRCRDGLWVFPKRGS